MIKLVSTVLFLLTTSLPAKMSSQEPLPLDMAPCSVDDSFRGCKKDMENLVMKKYIEYEKINTLGFKAAWENALDKCVNKSGLNNKQCAAIYLYTQDKSQNPNCSYIQFREACSEGLEEYKAGKFKFYTLYFFLTDAIQRLRPKIYRIFPITSYRRTNLNFTAVTLKQKIRFGSFTSTSLDIGLKHFGNVSCFQIKTRHGAKVQKYSALGHEKEVLIPPYEVFRITAIRKIETEKNLWCSVVYELKSAGTLSNLQCKIPKKTYIMRSYLLVLNVL
ncbi:ecto-ADP-ribosyltransferase 5-like [Hoplias malabaricus]|uniref:ecto-ADP-ribosyltransferase 5-like n=1 Tax=Hoplias malabaricus TaxID=27720 RepID=UPI003463044B